MARKQNEPVEPKHTRRNRWILFILIPILLIAAGLAWVFQGRLRTLFEAQATLPPPPPGETGDRSGVLYQTDFAGPETAAEWEPEFNDGTISAQITGGQLIVDVNAFSDTGTWLAMNYTFDNFVLDVDATKVAGPDDNGIIVLFRLQDDGNYNRFDISSDGFYSVSKVRGGQPVQVSDWNRSQAINLGDSSNHIRIRAIGDTFQFEVNSQVMNLCISDDPNTQPIWDTSATPPICLGGTVVETWHDLDLVRGKIGLGAQGFVGFDGENTTPALATIAFDNLLIVPPDSQP